MSVIDWSRSVISLFQTAYRLAQWLFNQTLRPHLPPKRVRLGGVETYTGSVLDRTLTDNPDYELEIRTALREHIREGDHVRIVGGGNGVTAIVATQCGAGAVEVMEAAKEIVHRVERVATLHDCEDAISVFNGHIGEVQNPWGNQIGPRISPDWCRHCDVLELDCEGAELDILTALGTDSELPRTMIIECHVQFEAPTADVRHELERLDYEIVNEANDRGKKNICVLSAVRKSASR